MNKVLMYHSIGREGITEQGAERYAVSVENFRKQIEYLTQGQSPSGTVPAITFDDGDITNYKYALPILKEFGLKAYFFIIVSKVGSPKYMNWEQIKALKDAEMIIGSHTMTHKALTGLNEGELDYELRISKKILEEKLGCIIEHLSIPRGFYNSNVIEAAKKNGYKTVFTSNYKDNDGFKVGRIAVRSDWSLEEFTKIIASGLSLKKKMAQATRDLGKTILGPSGYQKLRTKILK